MSDLLERFENLTINSSDDERNVLQGYVCKVKSEKKYFNCQNNFLVIPDQVGSKSKVKVMLFVTAVAIWYLMKTSKT